MIKKLIIPKSLGVTSADLDKLYSDEDSSFENAIGIPNANFSVYEFLGRGAEIIREAAILNKWAKRIEVLAKEKGVETNKLKTILEELEYGTRWWELEAFSFDDEIAGIAYQLGPKKFSKAIDKLLKLRDEGLEFRNQILSETKEAVTEITKINNLENERKAAEKEQERLAIHARLLEKREKENTENEENLRGKSKSKMSLLNWDYSESSQQHGSHVKHKKGWIYILSNQMMPKTFKIGFTSVDPIARAHQVTGEMKLPVPFEVHSSFETKQPFLVEQAIHEALKGYLQGREFFSGPPEVFEEVIKEYIIPLSDD